MPLIPTKTQQEQDSALLQSLVMQVGEAYNHAAAVQRNANEQLWSLPLERLLAILNQNIEWSLALLQSNSTGGGALNDHLDLLGHPQFTNRVPLTIGRPGISFDAQSNAFVYVEPVPEPEA